MKQGYLILFVCCDVKISKIMESLDMLFDIIGKPLMRKGALSWFYNVSTYNQKVFEY
jgi:hypothetical protein